MDKKYRSDSFRDRDSGLGNWSDWTEPDSTVAVGAVAHDGGVIGKIPELVGFDSELFDSLVGAGRVVYLASADCREDEPSFGAP